MLGYWTILTHARDMAPHGYCLLWQPELVWTHVFADALIAAAYFSIPLALVRVVIGRRDLEFSWIYWLFALFIVACGTTHLMSIWTLWHADYGWEALIKMVTAIASVGTAIVLWPLVPKALTLPSPLQLRQANSALSERVRERDEALERLQREVVERERVEAALTQAQKMEAVGQLTGGIAHDFNNLLQAVTGTLDLIAQMPNDADRVRRWAQRGLQAADRGARLTAQLLAFSRVQRLDLKPTLVAPLIENLLDMLGRTLGPSIRIDTEIEDAKAVAVADKTQLELAILNLAINARDAMPDGGALTIRTRTGRDADPAQYPHGRLDISVSDSGAGMPDEVRERAFEPFFTTKQVGKGTGLGLSMVYGVARQSGGDARIESTPGAGTTVTISLCLADPAAAARPAAATVEAELPRGDGERILLVDDDDDVRTTLAQALQSLGYEVEEAVDGPAALAVLRRVGSADLAVIDYAMPGMNGGEVAREARLIDPGLPVLFASGFAESDAVAAALGDGAVLLRKPFQLADLASHVAEALAARRSAD